MITKKRWLRTCEQAYDIFHDNPAMLGTITIGIRRHVVKTRLSLWMYNGQVGREFKSFEPMSPGGRKLMCGGDNAGLFLKFRKEEQ